MVEAPRASKLEQFARITQVASGLSVIVGIVFTLVQIYRTSAEVRDAAHTAKLSALPSIRELIKQDSDIRKQIDVFLHSYDKTKFKEVLSRYPDVEQAYFSDELAGLREVGHHYEQLGALLKTGYIDFDLIYEIVPFPDAFWEQTQQLRDDCKKNWSNGKGLPDFWRNFAYLKMRYDQRRAAESLK